MRRRTVESSLCWSLALVFIGTIGTYAQTDEYTIPLLSGSVIPDPLPPGGPQSVLKGKCLTGHIILQFRNELTPEQRGQLARAGIVLHEWLGGRAYSATVPRPPDELPPATAHSPIRDLVRSNAKFKKGDRLAPQLVSGSGKPLPEWAKMANTNRVKVVVRFFSDVKRERIEQLFGEVEIREKTRRGSDEVWLTTATPEQVDIMAGWDEIRFIEPGPRPIRPLDSGARELTNADAVQRISFNPHPRYDGWTGANIRIGICDQGIDLTNREFARLDKGAVALGQFRIFGTEADWAGHGTHVASIAAGNGINSQGSGYPAYSLRGFAPEAELGAYPFLGDDPRLHFEAAVTGRSDVTNHSYEESEGHYDGVSFFIDEVVRGDGKSDHRPIPARPQVWSAGNNGDKPRTGVTVGYYAMLTQAKNSISVGAVDSIDGHLSAFSSLGPTLDGRIKPDLVAPGAYDSRACPVKGILAARANARPKEELYVENYGTSMAAPVVSAAIALMKERRLKAPDGRAELRPSTYKALLIHSARDCVHTRPYEDRSREFNNPDTGGPVLYHAGPDFATGFGLVDVRAACDLIADPDLWREGSFTGPGQGRTFRVSVAPGEAELKAVIAWDDATDTERKLPFASRLVNDLDLSLIAPDGAEHLPWVLDPPPLSSAYRLRLLRGLADEKDLPEKGKALVVVATVKGTIHFRIFDGLGGRRDLNAADLPEKAPEIRGLEGQLKDLWTVRVLPERTKDRIIWSVSSIVDPDRRIDLGFSDPAVIDPEDLKPAYRGRDHRNNAEMVTVPFPRPGEWEIRVRSHRLRGPEQPFSVVCSSPIAR